MATAIYSFWYLPILKNAHTGLSNAVGDLRQKIQGATVNVHRLSVRNRQAMDNILTTSSSSVIFTVLRDPVDRFISATCEDLRGAEHGITRDRCFAINDLETRMDCVLQDLERALSLNPTHFKTHQMSQYRQLHRVMQNVDNPVFVVSFHQLPQLLRELGNDQATKVRDRSDSKYFAAGSQWEQQQELAGNWEGVAGTRERLSNFCKLTRNDLSAKYLQIICDIYRQDVELLTAVGFAVPSCESGSTRQKSEMDISGPAVGCINPPGSLHPQIITVGSFHPNLGRYRQIVSSAQRNVHPYCS
jgi:hypothetical protein